jgi:hypothetical protein
MFLQVRQKWRIMDKLDFPGVVLTRHWPDPVADLVAFARRQGISEAFVGQMTAVSLQKAQVLTLCTETLTVASDAVYVRRWKKR